MDDVVDAGISLLAFYASDSAGDSRLITGLIRGFRLRLKIAVGRKKTIVRRMLD
jgi:hypothetical protein